MARKCASCGCLLRRAQSRGGCRGPAFRRAGRSSAGSTVANTNDRRYLRRGSHCHVLQCSHRPEHRWLPIGRRIRIDRRRWKQHADAVHPGLRGRMASQRTVRLRDRAEVGFPPKSRATFLQRQSANSGTIETHATPIRPKKSLTSHNNPIGHITTTLSGAIESHCGTNLPLTLTLGLYTADLSRLFVGDSQRGRSSLDEFAQASHRFRRHLHRRVQIFHKQSVVVR